MAVLEQWEIDLRNQLLEGSESQREWEERLKEELQGVRPKKKRKRDKVQEIPPAQPTPAPLVVRPSKKSDGYFGYYVVIFLLLVMALFVYNQKSGGAITRWFENRIQFSDDQPKKQDDARPPMQPVPPDKSSEITQMQLDMAKLKQDVTALNDKLKWNSDRITLMGMLVNENFVIMANNYDRSHLIFFNSDWTINKMPRYLQIQEKDKEYLKKFVRP